jgi:hypothetical protein
MIEADLTEQIIGAAIEVHKHWGPDQTDGVVMNSLLRLPRQVVNANRRWAAAPFDRRCEPHGGRPSPICVNLFLALLCPGLPEFPREGGSVLPCLRGESSSSPLPARVRAIVPNGTHSTSGAWHMQHIIGKYVTRRRHVLLAHRFC